MAEIPEMHPRFRQAGRFVGLLSLLVGTFVLAWAGMPAEAGVFAASSCLFLVFIDLDRFESFAGPGVKAKLRKLEKRVAATIESNTEPQTSDFVAEPKTSSLPTQNFDKARSKMGEGESQGALSDFALTVLKALVNTPYTWRYLAGVAKDAGLPRGQAETALDQLVEEGLAHVSEGRFGTIWAPTSRGRQRSATSELAS